MFTEYLGDLGDLGDLDDIIFLCFPDDNILEYIFLVFFSEQDDLPDDFLFLEFFFFLFFDVRLAFVLVFILVFILVFDLRLHSDCLYE